MTETGGSESHMVRVSRPVLLSMRQLTARMEALAGRRVIRDETLRVALVCAENAEDDELIGYLRSGEQT